jgi:hypothetical protein
MAVTSDLATEVKKVPKTFFYPGRKSKEIFPDFSRIIHGFGFSRKAKQIQLANSS